MILLVNEFAPSSKFKSLEKWHLNILLFIYSIQKKNSISNYFLHVFFKKKNNWFETSK